jgi:ketosteroid isomerase-like protein
MFSYYISHGKMDSICYLYTQDAKLIPPGRTFVKGNEDICEFWKPDTSRTTVYHKTIPHEISIYGYTAYDYGTYEGRSRYSDGTEQDWQGKYLIIWKKENGVWKMYLDAWNR